MLIEPVNRLLVLVANLFDDPDNMLRFDTSRISQNLPKMTVIGGFKLVLDDYFSACGFFLGKDICTISANPCFGLNQRNIQADLIAQLIKILRQGKPAREIKCLMLPVITKLSDLLQLAKLHRAPIANCTASPSCAGLCATTTPAASSARILASAVPLPPAMMAPAWPMRLPLGAVRPAM